MLPISTISIIAHIELNIPIYTRTLFLYIILVIFTLLLTILQHSALYIEVCGVDDSPILGASHVAEAVKPQLLQGYDVPILEINGVEDIRLCHFKLMDVLLPTSEVLREGWLMYIH